MKRPQRRKRVTRPIVRIAERTASLFITVGGIGTIAAVALIFVFLVGVVLPLFSPAKVEEEARYDLATEKRPLHFVVDEYKLLGSSLYEDGSVRVVSLFDGRVLEELNLVEELAGTIDATPSAWSFSPNGEHVACALEDGSLAVLQYRFEPRFLELQDVPDEHRRMAPGEHVLFERGILQRTSEGAFRYQRLNLEVEGPYRPDTPTRILRLAHTRGNDTASFCAWTEDQRLLSLRIEEKTSFITFETEKVLEQSELAYAPPEGRTTPDWILLTGLGDNALVVWRDGHLERLDLRDREQVSVAETVDLVSDPSAYITTLGFLIGNETLLCADSRGHVNAWFRSKPEGAPTHDGVRLSLAHELFQGSAPAIAFAASPRSRVVAIGFEDRVLRLFQVTTQRMLAETQLDIDSIFALRIAPKEDGLAVLGPGVLGVYGLDPLHPEATFASLFTPIWYEGYNEPSHVWQAESATDDFEPKFGFQPLIYGTLKATLYSMLFGAPLAFLAAIFTSEFLDKRLRVPLKSTIEIMASLPSVVLGFLAGAVIAPFAEKVIPATLAVFVTLPLALLGGAYLWQLLPSRRAIQWSGWQRLVCILFTLPVGFAAALIVGPWIERLFFAGDIKLWLDGQIGSAVGGWMLIMLPVSALIVVLFASRFLTPWFVEATSGLTRLQSGVADIGRFATGGVLTVLVALALSAGLNALGLDPRGSFMGTYVQRNALIVGFVMGFAIIPIIYTLAEDALTSVPEHLRLASLGAGATPWQTAMRIIVPTAMSGLFSALMIGLGRAVGETMIVLMATGNTPVMEMNMFNGFRTLSANIAVELPEAVKDSTHYRILFLAALVLFAMTFVLNTMAEVVRQRFRKRSYQL